MRRFLLPCLLATLLMQAGTNVAVNFDNPTAPDDSTGPWFTGPLLTLSPHVIPLGHYNFEPYLFVNNEIGLYNNHWHLQKYSKVDSSINFEFIAQFGVTSWMDITIIPQFFYNYRGQQSAWGFGDLLVGMDFQLVEGEHRRGIPSVKLTIQELFPTGKYQHLNTTLNGVDATGGGSFATNFQIILGTHWHFTGYYYLAIRSSLGSTLFTQTGVHGPNAYGGDITTNGTVYPGTAFSLFFGLECSLTKHWVFALDIVNTVTLPTTFRGTTSIPIGIDATSYVLSFAPALEFNFNANVGLIFGVWASAIGTQNEGFINYVMALNWYV